MPDAIPVETRLLVTAREFETFARPGGRPLVVQGWMENWNATATWDFRFFRDRYGDDLMRVAPFRDGRDVVLQFTMAEYVDYILDRSGDGKLHRAELDLGLHEPIYCRSYKPFLKHPELWEDFTIPPFVEDWWPLLSKSFTAKHFPHNQGWVLLTPRDGVSPLHKDSSKTITWLAQVRGRKACYLYPPEDVNLLYQGRVDPAKPDMIAYPGFAQATGYFAILEPGDMLFLPPDWWHHVIALDDAITVSCNFVNRLNFGQYLCSVFGSKLPGVLAQLPDQVHEQ